MTAHEHNPNRAPLPSVKSTNSYWHKDPSKILIGLRSTKELPTNADVVIVGSGIAGAFAAWELLKGGDGNGNGIKSLVMLEAREVCWGATGRVSPPPSSYSSPYPKKKTSRRFQKNRLGSWWTDGLLADNRPRTAATANQTLTSHHPTSRNGNSPTSPTSAPSSRATTYPAIGRIRRVFMASIIRRSSMLRCWMRRQMRCWIRSWLSRLGL